MAGNVNAGVDTAGTTNDEVTGVISGVRSTGLRAWLGDKSPFVTLHRILMVKVKARARHAFTLTQKNLF